LFSDLAQNWNIDLARELEDYLAELETISIAFDGSGGATLNFAEAAMLIQGSACIYSKKVEYLYSLLYTTLDALIKKKHKQNRAASSVGPDGIDMDAIFDNDDPVLSDFAPALRQRSNVDLDADSEEPYAKLRKSQLVVRPPLSLISIDAQTLLPSAASTGSGFKLTNLAVHGSGALLLEERDRSLVDPVSRTDYGSGSLNFLSMNHSGASSLTPGANDSMGSMGSMGPFGSPRAVFARASLSPAAANRMSMSGGRLSVAQASAIVTGGRTESKSYAIVDDEIAGGSSVSHSLFEELTAAADENAGEEPASLADEAALVEAALPDYQHFGVDGGVGGADELSADAGSAAAKPEDVGPDEMVDPTTVRLTRLGSQRLAVSQQQSQPSQEALPELLPFSPEEEEDDPWERLDPYETVGAPKPFRKGRTYVKPRPQTDTEPILTDVPTSFEAQKLSSSLSYDPLEEMVRKNIAKGSIHVPYYAEFSSAYLRNLVIRKRVAKRAKFVLSQAPPMLKQSQPVAQSLAQASSGSLASPSRPDSGYEFISALTQVATLNEPQVGGLSSSAVGMLNAASNILGSSTAAAAATLAPSPEATGLLDDAIAAQTAATLDTDDLYEEDAGQVLFDLGALSAATTTGQDGAGAVEARDLWEEAAGAVAEEHAQEEFAAIPFDTETAQITKTYEELCREHVEQYLAYSARFINESSLVKRVNEWQRELEPILAEEAARKPFDIQECGGEIIRLVQKLAVIKKEGPDALPQTVLVKSESDQTQLKKEEQTNSLSEQASQGEVEKSKEESALDAVLKEKLKINDEGVPEESVEVGLPEILSGRPRYDVCRTFLATLQLANNGNIDIVNTESTEQQPATSKERSTRSGKLMNLTIPASHIVASSQDRIANPEKIKVKLLTTRRTYVEDVILSPSADQQSMLEQQVKMEYEDTYAAPHRGRGSKRGEASKKGKGKGKTTKRAKRDEVFSDEEFEEIESELDTDKEEEEEEEEPQLDSDDEDQGPRKKTSKRAKPADDAKLGSRRKRTIGSDSEEEEADLVKADEIVRKGTRRHIEDDEKEEEDDEEARKRSRRRRRA